MAALDYTEFAALARELIADAGRDVTFEVLTATPADADRPWRGPAAPAVASSALAPAAFIPATGGGMGLEFLSDELLSRAEQVCLVAPAVTPFDFAACHSITDGAQRWAVRWAHVLKPGALPVLYVLGVAL